MRQYRGAESTTIGLTRVSLVVEVEVVVVVVIEVVVEGVVVVVVAAVVVVENRFSPRCFTTKPQK